MGITVDNSGLTLWGRGAERRGMGLLPEPIRTSLFNTRVWFTILSSFGWTGCQP